MPACAVKWCGNHTSTMRKALGITFHSFPKNPVIRKKWRDAVRIERREGDWRETYHSKICSLHFQSEDFILLSENGNRLLTKTAVPICTMSLAFYSPDYKVKPEDEVPVEPYYGVEEVKKPGETTPVPPLPPPKESSAYDLQCTSCKKLFDPNDKNPSTTLEGQAKAMVANVYHFLCLEYKEIKEKCKNVDITFLANFRQRAANATGVSLATVSKVLREERYWKDKVVKQGGKKRKQCGEADIPPESEVAEADGTETFNDLDTNKNIDDPPENVPPPQDASPPQLSQDLPQTTPDISSLVVKFDDINANHILVSKIRKNKIVGNEPPPMAVNQVNVLMSEEEFFKAQNISVQGDNAINNGVLPIATEAVEIEFQDNMEPTAIINTVTTTDLEPQPIVTTEPIYCGIDPMNAVIAQQRIIEAPPIVTTDQLYCSMAPTIPANAISISQPMHMETQPLMPLEAATYMPIEPQPLMHMEAQQYIPMDTTMITTEPRYIRTQPNEMDHLANIQAVDFTPTMDFNYYVLPLNIFTE